MLECIYDISQASSHLSLFSSTRVSTVTYLRYPSISCTHKAVQPIPLGSSSYQYHSVGISEQCSMEAWSSHGRDARRHKPHSHGEHPGGRWQGHGGPSTSFVPQEHQVASPQVNEQTTHVATRNAIYAGPTRPEGASSDPITSRSTSEQATTSDGLTKWSNDNRGR